MEIQAVEIPISKYRTAGKKLARVVFGSHPPVEIQKVWEAVMVAAGVIDDQLDNQPDHSKRMLLQKATLSFLAHLSEDYPHSRLIELREALDGIEAPARHNFLMQLTKLFRVTETIRTETNPSKYAQLTDIEGNVFAKLLAVFLPHVSEKGKSVRLKTISRTGNLVDSALDIEADHRLGRTAIKPSASVQTHLLLRASRAAIKFLLHSNRESAHAILKGMVKTVTSRKD